MCEVLGEVCGEVREWPGEGAGVGKVGKAPVVAGLEATYKHQTLQFLDSPLEGSFCFLFLRTIDDNGYLRVPFLPFFVSNNFLLQHVLT